MQDESEKNSNIAPGEGEISEEELTEPEIYSIRRDKGGWSLNRRNVLRAGMASVVVAATEGCVSARSQKKGASSEPLSHMRAVTALTISPDGKNLYSAGEDNLVKFWSLPQGALFKAVQKSSVRVLATSLNGTLLVTGDTTGNIQIRLVSNDQIQRTMTNAKPVNGLVIDSKGDFIYSIAGTEVKSWQRDNSNRLFSWPVSESGILAIAISPDGKTLYTGANNGEVASWNLSDQRLAKHPRPVKHITMASGAGMAIHSIAVSTGDKLLYAAGDDKKIYVYSLPEGKLQQTLVGHTGKIVTLAMAADDKMLYSAGEDKMIFVWSLSTGETVKTLMGHTDTVTSLALTPDGALLASGSKDRTIRLWDLKTGESTILIDLAANEKSVKGTQFKSKDAFGREVTYTLPCGSPIPAGAVCVCNCVPGTSGKSGRSFGANGVCSCDLVCTCNSVCTCLGVCSCVGVWCLCQSLHLGGGSHYWHPN